MSNLKYRVRKIYMRVLKVTWAYANSNDKFSEARAGYVCVWSDDELLTSPVTPCAKEIERNPSHRHNRILWCERVNIPDILTWFRRNFGTVSGIHLALTRRTGTFQ
jgi:hypothetical protein